MFKKVLSLTALFSMAVMISCQDDGNVTKDNVSQKTLDQIHALGFSNQNVQRVDDGYLVEGDIVLHDHELNGSYNDNKLLRIAEEEQYRTTNLVTGTPRTIRVSMSSSFSSIYVAALDEAIARYNAQPLVLKFQRVTSGANINIIRVTSGGFLASAGFPSGGNPYSQIQVNTTAIGSQPQSTIASIIAHEMGHCIGFRHTDYMNRAYSCGGSAVNEGSAGVGAILIPGTPSGPDAGSWMLACIGSGQNRPFNANDRVALNYLY